MIWRWWRRKRQPMTDVRTVNSGFVITFKTGR